jgi:hypothetical protein
VIEDKGIYSNANTGIRKPSIISSTNVIAPAASLPGASQAVNRLSTAAVKPIDGVRKVVIEKQGEEKEGREKEEVEKGKYQPILRRGESERLRYTFICVYKYLNIYTYMDIDVCIYVCVYIYIYI